ncbi:unnamed protein product [Dracunculus medinensis]|uniref:vitamin-K-epoxide reductase (warfarin-sensitive) n=1 Tax=Dracunculus medinensis TaxID=318479 RepID=A0A0N4UGG6_DRAME|nr:unnamed protein product [Dracunculus medinensis]
MLYRILNFLIAAIGFLLSLYGLYVEFKLDHLGEVYQPMCDIATYISCSKAFRSSFGTGLGIVEPLLGANHLLNQKNPVFGIITYIIFMFFQFFDNRCSAFLSLITSVLMNILSVYLFFVLVYLRTICVVCFAIYFVNAVLLIISIKRYKSSKNIIKNKNKKRS